MNDAIRDKILTFFEPSETMTFEKGTILTFAQEDPAGVTLLLDGLVEQYSITPEGNKMVVNVFKPPAFYPISWAINRTPNTYEFAAVTDITVKRADPDDTVAFLQQNPDVTFDLLSRVYKGTDALLRRLVLAASGIASSRLVFELLIEAYRFGEKIDETTVRIAVKHSNLAARSGLARETVSRELHKLEVDQYLSLTKQGIVLDILRLEEKLDLEI